MQQAKHNDKFRFPEHSFINAVHLPFTNSMVLYFLFAFSLSSLDYLWAGDDRSAGLQSGRLGHGTS